MFSIRRKSLYFLILSIALFISSPALSDPVFQAESAVTKIQISIANIGPYNPARPWGCFPLLSIYVKAPKAIAQTYVFARGNIHVWNAWYSDEGNVYNTMSFRLRATTLYTIHLGGEWPKYKKHKVWVTIGNKKSNVITARCLPPKPQMIAP